MRIFFCWITKQGMTLERKRFIENTESKIKQMALSRLAWFSCVCVSAVCIACTTTTRSTDP